MFCLWLVGLFSALQEWVDDWERNSLAPCLFLGLNTHQEKDRLVVASDSDYASDLEDQDESDVGSGLA